MKGDIRKKILPSLCYDVLQGLRTDLYRQRGRVKKSKRKSKKERRREIDPFPTITNKTVDYR